MWIDGVWGQLLMDRQGWAVTAAVGLHQVVAGMCKTFLLAKSGRLGVFMLNLFRRSQVALE